MFFLAATLVGWIGGDFVYKKVAVKNVRCADGIRLKHVNVYVTQL